MKILLEFPWQASGNSTFQCLFVCESQTQILAIRRGSVCSEYYLPVLYLARLASHLDTFVRGCVEEHH